MVVDRRRLALGIAVVVVLALGAYTFWPATAPDTTRTPARARSSRPAASEEAPGPVAPVKLDALAQVREEPGDGATRNPFRFQPRVVAPPPRPVAPAPTAIEPPRPVMPPGPPPLPPIPLKLIGVLERANGVKWAVLTDGKSAPLYGKDGDIIDGRYAIVKIGAESIEMTYADGRGRQVIRLTGQ